MNSKTFQGAGKINLRLTLAPLRHGPRDPTMRLEHGRVWRAMRTPEGPATALYGGRGDDIVVAAWGPGAAWAVDAASDVIGLNDDVDMFQPEDDLIKRLHRHHPGLRMCRSNAVVETLVPTIIEQKVTAAEAHRSYRGLVRAYGEPAPGPPSATAGPQGLLVAPDPKRIARLPYHAFHRFGLERRRADFIRAACSYASRLEETISLPRDQARRRLAALPGVGPWTVAEVERLAYGDADAVRPNDCNLPRAVSWVLAGERNADDARMMELLEPYQGQRARVALLIELTGDRPPRRAPRVRFRNIERQ